MNKKLVCNFAVVRFLPYPETEEFVNIGVAVGCAQTRTFDFRLESRKRDRVTKFFSEMDPAWFVDGRRSFHQELKRLKRELNSGDAPGQARFGFSERDFVEIFRQVVAPRESLFRFGSIGTVLTDDVEQELNSLFEHYVQRQFATRDEYRETVMTRRLTNMFRTAQIMKHYHEGRLGNELYHVTMPFIHDVQGTADRAIKPLDLDKPDSTRVIEYGDKWCSRIDRLLEMQALPDQLLFVTRKAGSGKRSDAATEVCRELENRGAFAIAEANRDAVLEFARAV